tara:strand:- start:1910 stop:2503 length:594 start_codon:yes stop_codon:yes gene_type:complete
MDLQIFILFISYLLGSVPTGFLIAKYLKNIDLREIGSGSTGATNVLRNVGKLPAFFVFIIDVFKGYLAVKIASIFLSNNLLEVLAGLCALSGHIWPVWLKGKGGKAVASGLGVFLALSWKVGISSFGVFLLTLALSKIVSLSSIIAAIVLPILMLLRLNSLNHPYTIFSIIVSLLVIWKHRTNINRIIKDSEPRIKY